MILINTCIQGEYAHSIMEYLNCGLKPLKLRNCMHKNEFYYELCLSKVVDFMPRPTVV